MMITTPALRNAACRRWDDPIPRPRSAPGPCGYRPDDNDHDNDADGSAAVHGKEEDEG
ncbi:MAG: hypothetical protein KDN20_24965 [Verrucomicrobiae bacterium]|nr:hypothetical protein [Verrucomicrobiae bacterium]